MPSPHFFNPQQQAPHLGCARGASNSPASDTEPIPPTSHLSRRPRHPLVPSSGCRVRPRAAPPGSVFPHGSDTSARTHHASPSSSHWELLTAGRVLSLQAAQRLASQHSRLHKLAPCPPLTRPPSAPHVSRPQPGTCCLSYLHSTPEPSPPGVTPEGHRETSAERERQELTRVGRPPSVRTPHSAPSAEGTPIVPVSGSRARGGRLLQSGRRALPQPQQAQGAHQRRDFSVTFAT